MEELLHCVDHQCHDPRWSLVSPNHREPVCIACLLQLLQEPQLLLMKKKIILSEFLGLLCQQCPDLLCLMQGDFPVQSHLILTLLDLTKSEDQTFVSMAMEASLKLICQLKSESLVQCVMDRISRECCQRNKLEECLPVLVLLGRLLNDIPGLAGILLHQYEGLMRELGNGLMCPEESAVSAVVYVMIHVFKEDLQAHLPLKLCHQVHHSLIIHLARAHSQELQINLVGLLQRNLLNEQFTVALLGLSLEGSTLLTCLKKLLMSGNDVLQMSAVQSCCLILNTSNHIQHGEALLEADLAEVLFELLNKNDEQQVESVFRCLGMLAELEDFFTRCHSVYGIASVSRAINHVSKQKNPTPVRQGLQLLALILERQPTSIPLFSNPSDVKSCLVTIATGLEKHDVQVVLLSLQAFKAFLREIGQLLEVAGQKTAEILRHRRHSADFRRGSYRQSGDEKTRDQSTTIISHLLLCLSQATKVVEHCQSHPTAQEDTYCPPHLITEDTALSSFITHLLRCSDEFAIPVVMMKWENFSKFGDILAYFTLLHQLHCVCPQKMLPLKRKLVSVGFLSSTLDVKASFRSDQRYQSVITEVLSDFLTSLTSTMSSYPVDCELIANVVRDGLKQLHSRVPDLPNDMRDDYFSLDVCYVCLNLLSASLWHEDVCLPAEDIQTVLCAVFYHFPDVAEWPPLSLLYITFLTAWCYRATQFDVSHHCMSGFQSCLKWLSSNPLSSWYANHPVQFMWAFSNHQLAEIIGPAVLERWLSNLPFPIDVDKQSKVETPDDDRSPCDNQAAQVSHVFTTMMTKASFRHTVQTLLLNCTSDEILEKLVCLITESVSKCTGDRGEVLDWATNSLPQALHSVFFNTDKVHDNCIISLLHILLYIKENQKSVAGSADLKIIYHLLNLISQKPMVSDQVQEKCLRYISSSIQTATDQVDKTVSSMLLQRYDFLSVIEKHTQGPLNSALAVVSLGIVGKLMLACEKSTVPARRITLNLHDVIKLLNSIILVARMEAFRLLAAFFSKSCNSSLIKYEQTVAGDVDTSPLNFKHHRIVWIHCQQCVLQEWGALRDIAITCMHHVLHYLYTGNKTQGVKLLRQPWNRIMLDSLMEEFDGENLDDRTVQLFTMFLRHPEGHKVISSLHLTRLQEHLNSGAQIKNERLKNLIDKRLST